MDYDYIPCKLEAGIFLRNVDEIKYLLYSFRLCIMKTEESCREIICIYCDIHKKL